jgi:hypothetical protein
MAEMKLIKTAVYEKTVHMLYADGPTKAESTEWVEMRLKSEGSDNRRIAAIHKSALQQLRALIAAENRRLESLEDHIP